MNRRCCTLLRRPQAESSVYRAVFTSRWPVTEALWGPCVSGSQCLDPSPIKSFCLPAVMLPEQQAAHSFPKILEQWSLQQNWKYRGLMGFLGDEKHQRPLAAHHGGKSSGIRSLSSADICCLNFSCFPAFPVLPTLHLGWEPPTQLCRRRRGRCFKNSTSRWTKLFQPSCTDAKRCSPQMVAFLWAGGCSSGLH